MDSFCGIVSLLLSNIARGEVFFGVKYAVKKTGVQEWIFSFLSDGGVGRGGAVSLLGGEKSE